MNKYEWMDERDDNEWIQSWIDWIQSFDKKASKK